MNEITDQDVADADAMYWQWFAAITANPAALRELSDKFFCLWRQYNALRAKLDAVPVQAMGEMMDAFENEGFPFGYKRQRDAITSWLDAQVQP